MVRGYLVSALAAALVATGPIHAQTQVVTEKSAVREGFVFPASGEVRVLLFRPDVKVGETTTAGLFQTRAEWHNSARSELIGALRAASERRGLKLTLHDEENAALAEHRALFRLVVSAAIRHKLFGRDPLPSKSGKFDWSLGAGVARIAPQAEADYGLFLFSHDSFESAGRKAAQLVSTLMGGANNTGAHFGYAALVDLDSGDILWLNVDLKASGDVRTPEGAASRIEQLLTGFPDRTGQGQP